MIGATRRRTAMPTRLGALLALTAMVAIASSAAWANRLAPNVAKALGGSQKAGYQPSAPVRFRRLYRAPARLGAAAAVTLPAASTQNVMTNVGYLDSNHYQNVRDVAVNLLRSYSPDQHYFVAVGRSPVALATFMRELDDDMVMTFPASDMRLKIDPSWKQQYFDHFRDLIPNEILHGRRTIVLFDRAREGKTLVTLKGYLDEYLRSIGSTTQVRIVGISPQQPVTPGVEWVNSSPHPYLFKYVTGQYDHDEAVAPYQGKHRIGVHTLPQLVENPNHTAFRNAMRTRMQDDAVLDGILASEFAHFVR
jgi:hypothetical protein